MSDYTLEPVGFIRSTVKGRQDAPRQGPEGAPDVWLEIEPRFAEALLGMEVRHGESVLWRIGHELIVITWLHEAKRDVLKGHPRSDESRPLTGVFYTRSPARPNPLGLYPVTVREIEGTRVKIGPIGRLSRLLHRHDTSGANFPLRVRHPRPVARATFT
jgi:tRNA-Thr(GGU) m(6)t(6)A37 methyltransferase TsaA